MKTNHQWLATFAVCVALPFFSLRAAEPPLPTVDEILKRVAQQAKNESENDQAFKQRYVFVRSKVTEYRNARGELRKQEAKTSTNNPVAVKVVAPLASASAIKPESDEPVSEANSKVKTQGFNKKELLLNPGLLDRFDFTLVGRETTNGRPAFVLDMRPKKKNLPEQNFKDKFINKAAGRVWVDEAESVVMKADLHLTERVNVFGGVLGAVWKFTYGFDRERTPDGLWYVRASNWHLEGRKVIVDRIMDFRESKTHLRKVESLAQR